MKAPFVAIAIASAVGQLSAQEISPAVFEFITQDAPGEGFNDGTLTSRLEPSIVGDNPGLTLGELRENVLVAAGERWSKFLRSNVPIEVEVDFEDFGGSGAGGSITLAGASASTQTQNFGNAPLRDTLYPIALANSLAGSDLSRGSDISVTVNANEELSNSSSGSFTWYYGLDSNAPLGTIDFLDVIAHELGHGLGFAANVSGTTGTFFGGRPNAFSTLVFDVSLGLSWPQLTSTERFNSSRNDPNLTWSGPAVTNAIDGQQSFVTNGVNFDQSGIFPATPASFGGSFPRGGVTERLVLVDDGVGVENNNGEGSTADLAQPLVNGDQLVGAVALIARGIINFDLKVSQAESAGAIAAIIYNNTGGDARIMPSSDSPDPPTIPITFISENSGNALIALLAEKELTVAVFPDRVERQLDDADSVPPARRLRLFAPADFASGSSVSHWTTTSSPNLLMEPSITRTIREDLDLTPLLMKDIGWVVEDVAIPHLTYETYLAGLDLSPSAENLGPNDDFDDDGISNLAEYYYGTNLQEIDSVQFRFVDGELVHERSVTPNDLIMEYQTSSDLISGFERIILSESLTELTPVLREVRAPINTDADRGFFRLFIQQSSPE